LARPPLVYHQVIAPFPVTDTAGRLLEAAFLGGFNTPRPQLVDVDGDGDLDLFVQEVQHKISFFERDGQTPEGLPRFVFKTDNYGGIDAGQWYRFADVDRDGDLDLLTEQPFSYIKYYRNDGQPGGKAKFVLAADTLKDVDGKPLFADAQNIPQLGDLDCNGRADLLIGRVDGTVSRYEAAATSGPSSTVPVFKLLANEYEGIRIIGQGQIGGSGGPGGMIPGGGGNTPSGSARDSAQQQPQGQQKPQSQGPPRVGVPSMHGANTMALADVDGKGYPDLFWGDYFEPGLLQIPNTGTCASPNFKNKPIKFPDGAPIATSGYNAPAFGDINGDGKLDLVMGVLGGAYNPLLTSVENLYYVERTASGGWNIRTRQLLPVLDIGNETIPAIGDLDGDGDLDFLLANKIDPSDLKTSHIYRFENVGTKTKPEFKMRGMLPITGRFHFAPALGDLDGDGKLDLMLGQWGTQVAWYRATSSGFKLVDSAVVSIPHGSNTVPTLGDLDGDGKLDLLVGEASGWIDYYHNDGTKTKPKFTLVTEEFQDIKLGRRSTPHLVDIDHDGKLDLLVGSESSGLALFRNVGTIKAPKFERDSTFVAPVPTLSAPAAGDFNGDGKLELLVGNVGGGAVYLEQQ
jgi:hypothetical protein